MCVSVPGVVTHLNLVKNLHFVQLSMLNSTFLTLQELCRRDPSHSEASFVHFKQGKGFSVVAGLAAEVVVGNV